VPGRVTSQARSGTACLSGVSNLGIALIAGGFTVVAVIVTFAGNAVLARQRSRHAASAARDAAIAELLAASTDLLLAVNVIRAGWQHRTAWRTRLLLGAGILPHLYPVKTWKDFTQPGIQQALMQALTSIARQQDDAARTLALDYAAMVIPRMNRFFAAAVAITLGSDKNLADAARKAASAAGQLMETAGARPRKLAQARGAFEREMGAFRAVADKRRR
jgi:hypothetical protein